MTLLGLDYGEKYVGVAVTRGEYATPIATIARSEVGAKLTQIIKAYNPEKIILGIASGHIKPRIKQFGNQLKVQLSLPVIYQDETLTSQDAARFLRQSGRRRKQRKQKTHEVAAALILQAYLEEMKSRQK